MGDGWVKVLIAQNQESESPMEKPQHGGVGLEPQWGEMAETSKSQSPYC